MSFSVVLMAASRGIAASAQISSSCDSNELGEPSCLCHACEAVCTSKAFSTSAADLQGLLKSVYSRCLLCVLIAHCLIADFQVFQLLNAGLSYQTECFLYLLHGTGLQCIQSQHQVPLDRIAVGFQHNSRLRRSFACSGIIPI